jgi:deoxyribodipyrimidine photolyase-related protein
VWSSKPRIAIFLAAMRHFRSELEQRGIRVRYHQLDDELAFKSLSAALTQAIQLDPPERCILTAPGDYRVLESIRSTLQSLSIPLEIRPDRTFFTEVRDFKRFLDERKEPRMEFWYRQLRRRFNVLMAGHEPEGGVWNLDADNRKSFGKAGPTGHTVAPHEHLETETLEVLSLVNSRFKHHPGSLEEFNWPLTRKSALQWLDAFIKEGLAQFGPYEDAMWKGEPWLYHSRLSAALNLKLLSAQEVVEAAVLAYQSGGAPLQSVEGFVRQILGWREYVRGIYWNRMPGLLTANAYTAKESLPDFYWTGDTEMACLHEVISQTLRYGYAHHIQRLMVLGSYAFMLGVNPKAVHEWFLAVFVDAVEWVELPNTIGMSQNADGGFMTSKPYVATGKYIQKMSNYCEGCPYLPAEATGSKACPFTTLYWDFLLRHRSALEKNPRMALQVRNLNRLDADRILAIQQKASIHRTSVQGWTKTRVHDEDAQTG